MKNNQNQFIVIEGLDGVGKTTLSMMLVNRLKQLSKPAFLVKTPLENYNIIVPYINSKCDVDAHYLFYLSSIKHASEYIRKKLKNYTIVCDRYIYSTEAYHRARGLNVVVDIKKLNLLEPNYKFYINVADENIRRKRIKNRCIINPEQRVNRQTNTFYDKIKNEFKKFNLTTIDNTNRLLKDVVNEMIDKIYAKN